MKKRDKSKTISTPETEHDKEIAEHFGWNWSDNQKRLVKGNIEPIVYDGKQMYTDGLISTDNPAILAATKHYEICPGGFDQNLSELKKNAIQRMSVLHSDIAFVGTDGEIHLVEENIKPDYNEWNW